MARGTVNKTIILGRLGQDPEMRATASGTQVANLSIATNELGPKDPQTGQRNDQTEWHRIILFGQMAENANTYLKKGSQVYIEGRLQTRKWQDQNGVDRYSTEIVANEMQFIGGKPDGENKGNDQQGSGQQRPQIGNHARKPAPGFGNAPNTGAQGQQRTTAPSQGSGNAPGGMDEWADDSIPF